MDDFFMKPEDLWKRMAAPPLSPIGPPIGIAKRFGSLQPDTTGTVR
jgi:hypothetical protein